VLCFAPTRSGKGVGLVVPTLLTWTGSAIVHDIKGENWRLTAGWRARFGGILLFDPTSPASSAYNPLLEVSRGDTEVRDVQNVADILVGPEGALERRNHWETIVIRFWWVRCSTSFMPKAERRSPASSNSSPIPNV
jgi:type IV secretion system protein VirD4